MTEPFEISNYHSRELDQEIDTIDTIPNNPKYVVVGTYHLHKEIDHDKDDHDQEVRPALRTGSIQILPFSPEHNLKQPGPTSGLARIDLDCAIVDIKFHPNDPTLLGAATSTGQIRLFRVVDEPRTPNAETAYNIIELGVVAIYSTDDYETLPLITQFAWISNASFGTISDRNNTLFATCDSFGQTKLCSTVIPTIDSTSDPRLTNPDWPLILPHEEIDIHKQSHGLEAWTISIIPHPITGSEQQSITVLTGGDDNNLIASNIVITNSEDLDDNPTPIRVFVDKTTHGAGVVAILPIPSPSTSTTTTTSETSGNETNIPLLTGSYDESIRLFNYDRHTQSLNLLSSLELGSGVWRLSLLETYTAITDTDNNHDPSQQHYIILVSLMYAGARILRLTHDPQSHSWSWTIEARFTRGHESMVYACAAKKDTDGVGRWKVVSTSFYDKKVCNWEWTDEVRMRGELAQ